jgi:DNA helicase-2/ATP-dependent DNA helicase PcrA
METKAIEKLLLDNLTDGQKDAVKAKDRRLLVVAGAGSGKTEVMARRIAWWVGVEGVSKDQIVAFTFTERAAEEMKFRIRDWIEKVTPAGEEVSMGQMYVGTIHGFCLLKIREFWPDDYHNYDILDESSRASLILRGLTGCWGSRPSRMSWARASSPRWRRSCKPTTSCMSTTSLTSSCRPPRRPTNWV